MRSGVTSDGVCVTVIQDQKQTLAIYPQAKTYREWLKDSPLVKNLVQKLKAEHKSA